MLYANHQQNRNKINISWAKAPQGFRKPLALNSVEVSVLFSVKYRGKTEKKLP